MKKTTIRELLSNLYRQTDNQVRNQVPWQVWDQIYYQIPDQVRNVQIWVLGDILDQIEKEIK